MMKKCFMLVFMVILMTGYVTKVKAADNNLTDIIEETIENDKETLNSLSPILEKLYEKAIVAFRKFGTLSKDISEVVKTFNELDESAEKYEEKLAEFFDKYNGLSPFKRKVVDAITGLLDMKDRLKDSISHSVIIDLYSTKSLDCDLQGNIEYYVENETVATIDSTGKITPLSIGYTSITANNGAGDEVVYRVAVKKPVLSTSVAVQKKKTITIKLPDMKVTEIHLSNNAKVSCRLEGQDLIVKGIKRGNVYIYAGTESGHTLKYKIRIL